MVGDSQVRSGVVAAVMLASHPLRLQQQHLPVCELHVQPTATSGLNHWTQRLCCCVHCAAAAGGALSIVEASTSRIKFAAGAYTGALDSTPSSMAVFPYYLNVSQEQYCQ
jgi:hypothetical protein